MTDNKSRLILNTGTRKVVHHKKMHHITFILLAKTKPIFERRTDILPLAEFIQLTLDSKAAII